MFRNESPPLPNLGKEGVAVSIPWFRHGIAVSIPWIRHGSKATARTTRTEGGQAAGGDRRTPSGA